tara:strand:- start:332 stop:586 length:255 start_codon:yes stop_codon:yes gene_type:complete
MNTTSTQTDEIDLTGVTLTITLSEYEKLREMKKTNDTLLEELENMTKAYNKVIQDNKEYDRTLYELRVSKSKVENKLQQIKELV